MSPQENKKCLVVVANRLPFVLKRNPETGKLERKASAGGLVTAVAPVVIKGKGLWVGWPGINLENPNEPIPESDPSDKTPTAGLLSKQVVVVIVDPHTLDMYYNGCCNATFWPLFHSMPGRAIFLQETWKAYCTVNQIFADKTLFALKLAAKENHDNIPIVWVHDYHLMLASNWIRQAMERSEIQCKLAFFLHTPFPSWDIFRLLPWCDEILQGMLSCDLVGFHIEDYCINFVDCCQRQLGCRVDRKSLLVEYGGRSIIIRPLPIGIPFDRFFKLAEVAPKVLQSSEKIVLGVDRLDYTKGLVHRLKTFEKLLEVYPEHIEKVQLLQICVPSRTDVKEYKDLKEEMDQLVGCINGSFTTYNWSPIRYIYGCVSQDELAAFYRDAAVCLVTPLRDGMNLVAKEFVACQINPSPGVLIVSSFAGAAETMPEALICNPYEINTAADILNRALTMPEDERILRMNLLRRREKIHDVDYWMNSFLKAMGALKDDVDDTTPRSMGPVTMADFDEYLSSVLDEKKQLALLLDYDGTLAPLASHPDAVVLPQDTRASLERLSKMKNLFMAIVSGRAVFNVKEMVGIEGITYAGNHGHEILFADGKSFIQPLPTDFAEKINTLAKELQEKVCKDGAWVENKKLSLTYHYRETPMHLRQKLIVEAQALIEKYGLKVAPAHCAIEVKPPVQWNKGRACLYILKSQFGTNWSDAVNVIYVGDDVTDEDAMEALKGIAATFRVTSSTIIRTAAQRRLSNTQSVLTLLRWVESYLTRVNPGTS